MSDIHADSRSYALSIEDFSRLCTAYQQLCAEHPGLYEYDHRYNKTPTIVTDNIDDS